MEEKKIRKGTLPGVILSDSVPNKSQSREKSRWKIEHKEKDKVATFPPIGKNYYVHFRSGLERNHLNYMFCTLPASNLKSVRSNQHKRTMAAPVPAHYIPFEHLHHSPQTWSKFEIF